MGFSWDWDENWAFMGQWFSILLLLLLVIWAVKQATWIKGEFVSIFIHQKKF